MVFIRILILILFFISNGDKVYGQQNNPSEKTNTTLLNDSSKSTISSQAKREQLRNKKVVSLFIVLIIIISLLFYFVYQNNKLKQKIRRKDIKQKILLNVINAGIDSQENEQKKIASFLHDNINSLLTSASLHLNVYTTKYNVTSEEISKSKTILAEAHDLLRDMSHDLVPTLLVRFGLIYALEDLCEKNSTSNIRFEFSSSVPTEKRYPEKFEMKLYFIVTELFNNIIKHSGAQKAKITLQEKNEHFVIIIYDNGKGFKTLKLNQIEGFGLNRIRARIKKYKGSFSISSKENNGTTIKIQIPLPH